MFLIITATTNFYGKIKFYPDNFIYFILLLLQVAAVAAAAMLLLPVNIFRFERLRN